jgi:hypothetical protein
MKDRLKCEEIMRKARGKGFWRARGKHEIKACGDHEERLDESIDARCVSL